MAWGVEQGGTEAITRELTGRGADTAAVEADLTDPDAPARVFDEVEQPARRSHGPGDVSLRVRRLRPARHDGRELRPPLRGQHARHLAADPRVRSTVHRRPRNRTRHQPHQRPHRRQPPLRREQGALDRITLAAARELAHLGVTANAVNPGPVDTGWMSDEGREDLIRQTPLNRLGVPQDTANLVDFLCSPRGQWINGQLLMSNGGLA